MIIDREYYNILSHKVIRHYFVVLTLNGSLPILKRKPRNKKAEVRIPIPHFSIKTTKYPTNRLKAVFTIAYVSWIRLATSKYLTNVNITPNLSLHLTIILQTH